MKHVLVGLILITLFCAFPATAEVASLSEARTVAEAFVAEQTAHVGNWGGSSSARVTGCYELTRDGELLGYWAPVEPSGHVIISLLKEMPAIKAWSDTDSFDADIDYGYTALIKDTFQKTLDFAREEYGGLDHLPASASAPHNRESWQKLMASEPLPRTRDMIGPVLSTNWHQESPYWNDCPDGDGGLTLVGCVSTSASMIMKYWEYPEYGIGGHGYDWDGDDSCGGSTPGEYLYVEFSDPYDWANIKNSYTGGYTPEEAAAVAELNYEVAVAFEMDFGHCGSGSYVTDGVTVYPDFFDYSDDIELVHRDNYTQMEWWDIICHEIRMVPARPIHYRIYTHSIICDGINDLGGPYYYHLNYGWGGGYNSWYSIDNLYCPWSGCGLDQEWILINIEPKGFFDVTAPDAETIWYHDEAAGLVEWTGCTGTEVFVDLYQGDTFVANVIGVTPNDGSEDPGINVDPAWGTGSNFRLKVIDENNKFGWSADFGIYGGESWTDVTTPVVGDTGGGQAVAWGDLDGDGFFDIYTSNDNEPNRCYDNAAGTFVDATVAPLDISDASRAAAWGDYDNDGDLDLYAVQTSGDANYLFRNDAGTFVDATSGDLGDTSYSEGCAWGDYDGDGYLDLYVTNVYAADKLFHNNGDGSFSVDVGYPMNDAGWGRSATWGDYDNDGDLDLYLMRSGQNRLYRNNGNSTFLRITTAPVGDGGNGYGAAWGDYDNDGDLDLYLVNDGANVLLGNNGDGTFSDVTTAPLDDAGAGRSCAWGDYDSDGDLDLLVTNNGGNHLFKNQGGGLFTEATDPLLGDSGTTNAAAWADFDNDGDLDVYMANDGGENKLVRNDFPPENNWLQVKLTGVTSNKQGIGAKVSVTVDGLTQMHAIGGDAGYMSQNMAVAHFGFGEATGTANVLVTWPGGGTQIVSAVELDQRITIEESDETAVDDAVPAGTRLLANYPNPFNPKTEIRFNLDESASVNLAIFDLSGRKVRDLIVDAAYGAGQHGIVWDGTDKAGKAQGSGIYFYRLTADDFVDMKKMTLLK